MKKKITLLLVLVLLLSLVVGAFATAAVPTEDQESVAASGSGITASQEAWLNLINYDNVVRNARTLSEYPFGSRVGASWRYDMFIEFATELLESWGYEPWIHEFESDAPNLQSPAGAVNRRYNNGWVEVGGRKYMLYGPAFAAAGSAYTWSVPNGSVSASATGTAVIPWVCVASPTPAQPLNRAFEPFVIPAGVNVAGRVVFVPLGDGPTMHQVAMQHPTGPAVHAAVVALEAAGAEAVIFQSRPGRTSFISPFTPFYNVQGDPSTYSWGDSVHGRLANVATGTPVTIPMGIVSYWQTYESFEALAALPANNNVPVEVGMVNRNDGQNLIAVWESSNPNARNIYLSNHPDSVVSAPGFNDTVVTTTFALELMRVLATYNIQLEHNIVFAGWDLEELGLLGATYYVNDMITGTGGRTASSTPLEYWGMYNMDMMAPGQPECIYLQMHVHVPNPVFTNIGTAAQPNWQPAPPAAGTRIPPFGPGNFNFYIRRLAMNERARDSAGAMAYALQFPVFQDTINAAMKLAEDGRHEHRQIVVDPDHHRYGLPFDVDYHFNITWGGGTDHVAFVREWYLRPDFTGRLDSLRNSAQFDWRRNGARGVWGAHLPSDWMPGDPLAANPGNTGHAPVLEILYHKIGDTYQDNFSRDRLEVAGDIIWLAIYTSAQASPMPTFSLDIFNNGPVEFGATPSRPNASLAHAERVRMWMQLDGRNTTIPYEALNVSAVFPDGECAMEFIRVNNMWENPGNVNLIDAMHTSLWDRIYLTVTAFGQTLDVVLVTTTDGLIVVPQFLHESLENYIDVYVSYGLLAWNASAAVLTNTPGPREVEGRFVIEEPGWYTIFHRGNADTAVGDFYLVHTYFYVSEDLFVDGEIVFKDVPIENNRRGQPTFANLAGARRHPHEPLGQTAILRLEPIGNRFGTDGVLSIAAAEFDGQGNRTTGRWSLGSDVIPWSGPGHFQTPMFRNQIFCDDTGHLVGLVDYTRPLFQWTTQQEGEAFMADLAATTSYAFTFNAGWGTNPFAHEAHIPIDFFQQYFMVFTSTNLAGVTCWEEAGRLIQENGKPTFWANSSVHGNEQGTSESMYALMYNLANTPWGAEVIRDINIVLYPTIQRAGHFQHARNLPAVAYERTAPGRPAQGSQDGNRDWNVQHTQELNMVTSVFHAFRPHLAIDHHERGRIGGYTATVAGMGNRWTGQTGRNNVGGSDTSSDDIQWAPSNSPEGHPLQVELLAEVTERFFNDALDAGVRVWYYDNLVAGPTQGNYWMGLTGAISMISEINGQASGNEIRRAFSSYASMRSMIDWMVEEADRVHDTINQVRAEWAAAGAIYDPTDMFTLEHTNDIRHPQAAAAAIPEDSNLPGWTAGPGTVPGLGIRTGTVPLHRDMRFHEAPRYRISLDNQYIRGWEQRIRGHDVIRSRSFPTAYVVPMEIDWDTHGIGAATVRSYEDAVGRLRQMLLDNAVEYFILDAGAVMPLQQYYAQNPQISPMTRNFRAGLRPQETVTFDVPVLFIPMDQWTRPVIAHIMEPDMGKTVNATANGGHSTSWANMLIHTGMNPVFADGSRTLLHCRDTNNFPIFRLTEDNPRDFKVPPQVHNFGLDIFNNGPVEFGATPSRPNESLAQAGMIRMWTQLDGVNALIPYAELDVSAVFSNGDCAMEFIRVNNMWENPGNVNLIDAINTSLWDRIYLTVTAFGETLDIVLVTASEGVVVVPQFLHESFENYIDIYVSNGMLPWNVSVPVLTSTPGPLEVGGRFVITEPGWYTIFHRGNAETEVGEFYLVKTYFYVSEDLFVEGEIVFKDVPIENNRRAQPTIARVGAASNFADAIRHPHESVSRYAPVRLEPIGNRFSTDGVMSIAAAEFDAQGNRTTGRWSLGSEEIPWSGPGHFQTPMFRNQIFCDDTGHLVGLVDYTRPLFQWTTQLESVEFLANIANTTAYAYKFNPGWATNPFVDTDLPIDFFQHYFMVFTTTDLSGVTCWEEAAALVQANGKPTFWSNSEVHGNEQGTTESLYALMYSLANTPWGAEVVQDINVVIYPRVNRAGHMQHRRHIERVEEDRTAPGRPTQGTQDGNRDWNVQHTQEIEMITSVFHAFTPHMVMDLHERGRIGGYSSTVEGRGSLWTSQVGVNNAGGSDTSSDDMQWAVSSSPEGHPLQLTLTAELVEYFFPAVLNAGIRIWYYDNLVAGPTQGNYWMGLTGAITVVSEINGQSNGNEIRRVFGLYASVRSAINWLTGEAERVHDDINQVRKDFAEAGRTYDPTDLFTLEHTNDIRTPMAAGSVIPEDSNLPGWMPGPGMVPGLDIRTGTVPVTRDYRFPEAPRFRISLDNQYMHSYNQRIRAHDIIRARSFPTAYIVPMEIEWSTHAYDASPVRSYADAVGRLRQMLSDNNIEYFILEAGMTMPLQQYYAQNPVISPMTRNFRAGLRPQEVVTFDVPVLFVPMDQWTRPLIAHLMEPDVGKTMHAAANTGHATSWVSVMFHTPINPIFADGSRTLLHCQVTNNFPIFRLTEDNPRDFKVPPPVYELSFDIFNNGEGGSPSRPNASLYQAGFVRMWVQLDGVGASLPYPNLSITATLPDGTSAMQFVRVNRAWVEGQGWQDHFSSIDILKGNGDWEIINFSITVFNQTVEVVLVNNRFVPPTPALDYELEPEYDLEPEYELEPEPEDEADYDYDIE